MQTCWDASELYVVEIAGPYLQAAQRNKPRKKMWSNPNTGAAEPGRFDPGKNRREIQISATYITNLLPNLF